MTLLQLPYTVGTWTVHQPGASEGAERGRSPLVWGFGQQLEGDKKAEKVVACPKQYLFNNHQVYDFKRCQKQQCETCDCLLQGLNVSHYELHSQGWPFSMYLLPPINQSHCFFVTLFASGRGPGHRSSGEWGFCQKDPKCQWADRSMLTHTSLPSETIITSHSQKRIYKCRYLGMILLHMISCILLMLIQYFPLDFCFL